MLTALGLLAPACIASASAVEPATSLDGALARLVDGLEVAPTASVAILGFETSSGGRTELSRHLDAELHTAFITRGRFTVVERAQLEALLRELDLQTGDLFAPSARASLGHLRGVDAVAVGVVTVVGDDVWLTMRVVEVETGRALAGASTRLPLSRLPTSLRPDSAGDGTEGEEADDNARSPIWKHVLAQFRIGGGRVTVNGGGARFAPQTEVGDDADAEQRDAAEAAQGYADLQPFLYELEPPLTFTEVNFGADLQIACVRLGLDLDAGGGENGGHTFSTAAGSVVVSPDFVFGVSMSLGAGVPLGPVNPWVAIQGGLHHLGADATPEGDGTAFQVGVDHFAWGPKAGVDVFLIADAGIGVSAFWHRRLGLVESDTLVIGLTRYEVAR